MKTGYKTLLLALVLFLCSCTAHADPVSDGLKRARAQGRAVVMYFYSQYCPYCDAMDSNVLNDNVIGASLKKDFVYIRADIDHRPDLARKYQIRGYPTTILTESNGRIIVKIPGYIPKTDFRKILSYLKGKHYKTMSLGDYLKGGG
ncbi:MAG: thioredoxin fold domain-containing protein [Syntrophorhabdaceae bacterium]|nr:thioredoxin fold domain-containing protein [Syntrophorhabdaceae bacterium]MDD5243509.1 thioredoxin fold domain-containing protein [Syntrophorhabdaceae bacterium]